MSRVPDRARVLRGGFNRTLARLHEDGHHVVMVLPMYWFGDVSRPPTMASCPTLLGIIGDDCPTPLPVERLSAGQRAVRAQVADVARRAGAVPLDLLDRQCPRGVCTAYVGTMPMYADTGTSAQLSAAMWPDFAGAVRRADP